MIKQGEICQKIAFINQGILRVFYLNETGEEITSCFCIENHLTTSYKSFVLQMPSNLSIQALEATQLLIIDYQNLQNLYKNSPVWQNIGRIFAEKEYITMEKYASKLNNETTKEKYLHLLDEQPQIIQKVPLQFVASYLGVTVRTLSRIRKELAKN